jgi:hypothetical protein
VVGRERLHHADVQGEAQPDEEVYGPLFEGWISARRPVVWA